MEISDTPTAKGAEILLRYLENGVDIRQFIRTCSFRKQENMICIFVINPSVLLLFGLVHFMI